MLSGPASVSADCQSAERALDRLRSTSTCGARTWDPVTFSGTAHVYRYDSETEESLDLVLEFKAGVLASLREGRENTEEGWWNVWPAGSSYPPACEGHVSVVVGPTSQELRQAFPSARVF